MRIYLCSPYSAPTAEERLQNVRSAIQVALDLMANGYQPYVPVLSHYLNDHAEATGRPVPYARWMELDIAWLVRCDAVFVIAESPGVRIEMAVARALGIPICFSIDELQKAMKRIGG